MTPQQFELAQRIFLLLRPIPAAERESRLLVEGGDDQEVISTVRKMLEQDHDGEGSPTPAFPFRVDSFLNTSPDGGTPPAPAASDDIPSPGERAGDRIGPYRLLEIIGEGGCGIVWLAERRTPIIQRVALKVIKPGMDTRAVIARFEQERQALAIMSHPNIATILDAGSTDSGRPYFVMELVKGEPITDYCDKKSLDPHARLRLFAQVCRAVQHAHRKGIVHRDIKPSNVLVTIASDKPVVKVIDFGIAKAIDHILTAKTLFTRFHQLVGTPEYMSPEQAEMTGVDIDTRSDIYSLGVLLYELLTGSTPLDSRTLRSAAFGEMIRLIREVEAPKPSTRLTTSVATVAGIAANRGTDPGMLAALLRGDLDSIVLKSLDKDRDRRYETALDFAEDVDRYLAHQPVIARPASALYRASKFVRRNRGAVFAGVAALVLLAGGLAGTSTGMVRARRAQQTASEEAAASLMQTEYLVEALESPSPMAEGPDVKMVEVLRRAERGIDKRFAEQPRVRLALHRTYGRVYRALGMHADAAPHFQSAAAAAREFDPSGDLAADLLGAQAACQIDAGKHAEAKKSLAASQEAEAPDAGPSIAAAISRAHILHDYGDYELAEYVLRDAEARARANGDSVQLGNVLAMVTFARIDQGDLATARAGLAEATSLRRNAFGPCSPQGAFDLLAEGYLLDATGDSAGAVARYRAAREVQAILAGESPNALGAIPRLNLAGTLEDAPSDRPVESLSTERLFDTADLKHLEHLAAVNLRNRGRLLCKQGRFAEGADRFERSIASSRMTGGELGSLQEAHTRRVWAGLLMGAGQLARAEEEYRAALDMQRLQADQQAPMVPTLIGLGELLTRSGRAAEADPLLQEALAARRSSLPADAWPIAAPEAAHAACLVALGHTERAEPLLRHALDITQRADGADHRRTLAIRGSLAALYDSTGRKQEAEALRNSTP